MPHDPRAELETLIRARYPVILVVSWEEERVEAALADIGRRRGKKLLSWTSSRGLHTPSEGLDTPGRAYPATTAKPLEALDEVLRQVDPALFLFKDLHPFMDDPVVVRKVRDLARHLRSSPRTLLLLSPRMEIPPDLEKDVAVVDFGLPHREDLEALLDRMVEGVAGSGQVQVHLPPPVRDKIVSAARGLTLTEAENALARTLIERGRLGEEEVERILEEKKGVLRKTGILEYYDAREPLEDVGGLAGLKEWVRKRAGAFSREARQFGLPPPKGMLLLGVQGCGKSLCARAVSRAWNLPLLRLDVGRLFGSLMGSSEANVRRATSLAETLAPDILWIDEIDKAFAGSRSGEMDGGTSARVFGTLLTWLQEKTAPVFVVATANQIANLPPELLRKGRFDEIFFVDLPEAAERRDILQIHLRRRGRDPERFDVEALAAEAEGFSGSEIEQAVISGLYDAYDLGRDLETEDVRHALGQAVPLSTMLREDLQALRAWCRGRARPASV